MLTCEKVLSMKPGSKLDLSVCEKVMKWTTPWEPFFPSTDNAAALEVAIHLQKQGYYVCIELKACEETSVGVYEENPVEQIAYAKAQTPAEAICKAALLAVMGGGE